ncbi:MAG: glycosyltransferase [Pontiella sp.]
MKSLSIITVVRNDLDGLKGTIASVEKICNENIEHWVIDGVSNDGTVDFLKSLKYEWLSWISEPDTSLYDAMNKGMGRVRGDYVLFLNAGDVLNDKFSWHCFLEYVGDDFSGVLLGRTIECYKDDLYLRPGYGKEHLILSMPAHQATFYPKAFYQHEQYSMDRPVAADAHFTARAIKAVGYFFVPDVVTVFELGGVSSSYGSLKVLKKRWSESHKIKNRIKLAVKFLMWRLVSTRCFYRILALGKYTKLEDINHVE